MTWEDFSRSLENSTAPETLSAPLHSLWQAKKGDWARAHQIVQSLSTEDAAWVHAWLHRKEGDDSNANYWYGRANQKPCTLPLETEWEHMVRNLLFR